MKVTRVGNNLKFAPMGVIPSLSSPGRSALRSSGASRCRAPTTRKVIVG
jgi:hypothetical protein